MTVTYQLQMTITVFDHEELARAAKAEALKSMSEDQWRELRGENWFLVCADIHMLLDPGVSPPGTNIDNCEIVYLEGDDSMEEK